MQNNLKNANQVTYQSGENSIVDSTPHQYFFDDYIKANNTANFKEKSSELEEDDVNTFLTETGKNVKQSVKERAM